MKVGIIGGTGLYELGESEEIIINTPYGDIPIFHVSRNKNNLFFLTRHGKEHKIPPHAINYWGNIQAMESCGVDYLIALCTVGSMKEHITPGSFVLPSDFIDFTKRKTTFFDNTVVHIDMSVPFCSSLQGVIKKILQSSQERVHSGIYVATEGPRLETKAEIKMLSHFGDIVGMTLVPEVILAREKGLCYVPLCLVSNMCTGLQDSLPAREIIHIYDAKKTVMTDLLFKIIDALPLKKTCNCSTTVQNGCL
jgi:5'-methylthioadenosine phosphorylase